MTVKSMTGFARQTGSFQDYNWSWEIKGVNGKGLDVRFRVPAWLEGFDHDCKKMLAASVARGSVFVSLDLCRSSDTPNVSVNRAVLNEYLEVAQEYEGNAFLKTSPPSIGELLSLKGVVDISETQQLNEAQLADLKGYLAEALHSVVVLFNESRMTEGQALAKLMRDLIATLKAQLSEIEECDGARLESIKKRFSERVKELMGDQTLIDSNRLDQELAHLAVKADIREEIDRLRTHLTAADALLEKNAPIGREFDFLTQELNREVNTLCSKSSDQDLTAIGLKMKVIVDQLREQIQNIE